MLLLFVNKSTISVSLSLFEYFRPLFEAILLLLKAAVLFSEGTFL